MSNNIPDDITKIILRYSGKREIFLFQDKFPELLKYIIIDNKKITNEGIKPLNMSILVNSGLSSRNERITDEGIKH